MIEEEIEMMTQAYVAKNIPTLIKRYFKTINTIITMADGQFSEFVKFDIFWFLAYVYFQKYFDSILVPLQLKNSDKKYRCLLFVFFERKPLPLLEMLLTSSTRITSYNNHPDPLSNFPKVKCIPTITGLDVQVNLP